MAALEMPKLWYQARDYARFRGFHNDAEDFAQECYMKIKGGRHTTIENIFIDFIRERFGRNRKKKDDYVSLDVLQYTNIEDREHDEAKFEKSQIMGLITYLSGLDRAIFALRFLYGFSQQEVGYCFDLTIPSVSLRLKKITETIRKRIMNEKHLEKL